MQGRRESMRSLSSCGGAERACLLGFASKVPHGTRARGQQVVMMTMMATRNSTQMTQPSHTYTSYRRHYVL